MSRKPTSKYYPYGDSRNSQGDLGTDKLFTGQRLDGTGLYYYGARYYDPAIGRFISPDTIVPDFRNPQSLNRYSYVYNNPLKYTDPSGHFAPLAAIGIAAGVGTLVSSVAYGLQVAADPDKTFTWAGLAGAAVAGAVAGAGSVLILSELVGLGVAGVLIGTTAGGVSGVTGYGAGIVTENVLSKLTGEPDQSTYTDEGALVSLAGGAVGSVAGQGVNAAVVGTKATLKGGLSSGLDAFWNSFGQIEATTLESTLIGSFVSAASSSTVNTVLASSESAYYDYPSYYYSYDYYDDYDYWYDDYWYGW